MSNTGGKPPYGQCLSKKKLIQVKRNKGLIQDSSSDVEKYGVKHFRIRIDRI